MFKNIAFTNLAKTFYFFIFLGFLVFGTGVPVIAQETYELTYRFKKGDQFRWKVVQQLCVKTSMEEKTDLIDTISISTKLWTVTGVDADGTATIEHQVEEVDMHRKQLIEEFDRTEAINTNTQRKQDRFESSYNSKTDQEVPDGYEQVSQSLNIPLLKLKISPNGELLGRVPLVPYTLETLDSKILIPLPKGKIKVGDTWKVPEEAALPQPNGTVKKVRLQKIYTLNSVRNGLAVISYKTERLSLVEEPKSEIQLFDKLASGRVELDLETGHILKQQTDVKGSVLGFAGASSSIDHTARLVEEFVPKVRMMR